MSNEVLKEMLQEIESFFIRQPYPHALLANNVNMSEIECGVYAQQQLLQRLEDEEDLSEGGEYVANVGLARWLGACVFNNHATSSSTA
jgi:hypothetical protein